ncbi:hypothetical protein LOZ12_002879 [Ophidiomyces ophidiicola]|uniref:Uncharacterized protein n=1 Tax=Ophidiomyces ophidiicola TaxID=1387563 RepID=A0ACB8UZK9_9EURO|nr:hypothetical protein LOZ64_000539 [Ophidiomyces ophidiicola]KAI1948620.1 hypothetical protein LOZ62_002697 [Ophidiomyces ophidiicola]KAI1958300.1 hypothetical protein LOZ59_003497 [Ophidiomyces ophidiicola]KAI1968711.1 hypothetical protein LOZ56_004869 [Ophidiomyces ophidiicola]KAI2023010.1 hypothetical protein LOZ46_001730 [Ophidiomyces ophidiicola]
MPAELQNRQETHFDYSASRVSRKQGKQRHRSMTTNNQTNLMAFAEIPLIDLSLAADPLTRPLVLAQLHRALISVGFLYVSNHGVPDTVVRDLVQVLPRLFGLDRMAKDAIAMRNSPHFLGYSGVGAETTGGQTDSREQVEFATELAAVDSPAAPLYEKLRGPNQVVICLCLVDNVVASLTMEIACLSKWPSELPNLRPIVTSYIDELTALGERFLRLVADALSLPSDVFLPFLSDQHRLKLVHYPGSQKSHSGSSCIQGVGPHKDSSGWWTFLLQASPPDVKGLQVLNKNGDWIDVPVIPGTFVVNIGQAFEVVTNGVCKATTHRVLISGEKGRYSVPFFQGVRRSLTKSEATETLKQHFSGVVDGGESAEGSGVDSAFLKGKYDTWGESQLRTKIRSHKDVGKRFYGDVFDLYVDES